MKLKINSHKVALTSTLREAIRDVARLGLEMVDAPPTTPIVIDLKGPNKPEARRHSAVAEFELPQGPLCAEGFGPGAEEAVLSLRGAVSRKAQQWQVRHANKREHGTSTLLRGDAVDERAIRDDSHIRPPPKSPDSVSARRPLGSR